MEHLNSCDASEGHESDSVSKLSDDSDDEAIDDESEDVNSSGKFSTGASVEMLDNHVASTSTTSAFKTFAATSKRSTKSSTCVGAAIT